jgi:hypothetical protein
MARFCVPSLKSARADLAVLKLCLQLLVCLSLALRLLALWRHLRQAWRAPVPPENGLAADFRAELRRRGLFSGPPLARPD